MRIKEWRICEALHIPDSEDENLFELQEISEIYYATGLRDISRVNQEKQVELRYQYNEDVYDSNDLLDYARSEIEDLIQNANIPSGVAVELVQEDSGLDEFKYMFLIAMMLVYMILAAIFESFVTPFVLLFSIPLAAIGSFFLLTVTGESLFNANTIMGFLILLGVVVNNGIILIDFINVLRKKRIPENQGHPCGRTFQGSPHPDYCSYHLCSHDSPGPGKCRICGSHRTTLCHHGDRWTEPEYLADPGLYSHAL